MPLRKLLYSGSNAQLASLRVDNAVSASQFSGSFFGNGSGLTGIVASATPAGPNQSVQFNDNGASSGSAKFRYDKISDTVYLTGSLIANSITSSLQGSSSYSLTSSFNTTIFSRGGTIADLTSGVSTTGSYMVWRAPYTCQAVALYGKKEGTGTPQVNAIRSGSAGYAYHTGSNISLSSAHQWFSAATIQNSNYATGDSLEIVITGSGASEICVQVDFIRI